MEKSSGTVSQGSNASHRLSIGSYFVNIINKLFYCKIGVFTCILKLLAKTLPNSERQEERVAKVFECT